MYLRALRATPPRAFIPIGSWVYYRFTLNDSGGIWFDSAMRILENPHCGAQPNFEHFEFSLSTSLEEFGWTLQCGFSRTRTAERNQIFMHFEVPLSTTLGGIWLDSAMRILENPHCGVQPNFHAF